MKGLNGNKYDVESTKKLFLPFPSPPFFFFKVSNVNNFSGCFDNAFYSNTSKTIFPTTRVSELKEFLKLPLEQE